MLMGEGRYVLRLFHRIRVIRQLLGNSRGINTLAHFAVRRLAGTPARERGAPLLGRDPALARWSTRRSPHPKEIAYFLETVLN